MDVDPGFPHELCYCRVNDEPVKIAKSIIDPTQGTLSFDQLSLANLDT